MWQHNVVTPSSPPVTRCHILRRLTIYTPLQLLRFYAAYKKDQEQNICSILIRFSVPEYKLEGKTSVFDQILFSLSLSESSSTLQLSNCNNLSVISADRTSTHKEDERIHTDTHTVNSMKKQRNEDALDTILLHIRPNNEIV